MSQPSPSYNAANTAEITPPIISPPDINGHYAWQPGSNKERGLTIFACLLLVGVSLLIWLWQKSPVAVWPLLLCALYLSCMEWGAWRRQRNAMRHAIGVDADGLWLSARGKADGLVRWDAVAVLRERNGELVVLDTHGQRLIGVSLYLNGAERLTKRLLLTVPVNGTQQTFHTGFSGFLLNGFDRHSLFLLFPAIMLASANLIRGDWFMMVFLFSFGGLLLAILWLFNTLYRIDILPDGVKLSMPLRRRFFRWSDIRSIHLGGRSSINQTAPLSYPAILLEVVPGTPGTDSESLKLLPPKLQESNPVNIPINGFGRVPAALFQALHHGWQAAQANQDQHPHE